VTPDDAKMMVRKRLLSEMALPQRTVDFVCDILSPTIEAIAMNVVTKSNFQLKVNNSL